MGRASAFAVLRLITSSYLVGACTGRSAGFSPLRMRSTYVRIRAVRDQAAVYSVIAIRINRRQFVASGKTNYELATSPRAPWRYDNAAIARTCECRHGTRSLSRRHDCDGRGRSPRHVELTSHAPTRRIAQRRRLGADVSLTHDSQTITHSAAQALPWCRRALCVRRRRVSANRSAAPKILSAIHKPPADYPIYWG